MNAAVQLLVAVALLINASENVRAARNVIYEPASSSELKAMSNDDTEMPANGRNAIRQKDVTTYELGSPDYEILNGDEQPEIITEDQPHYYENLKRYGQLPTEQHGAAGGGIDEENKNVHRFPVTKMTPTPTPTQQPPIKRSSSIAAPITKPKAATATAAKPRVNNAGNENNEISFVLTFLYPNSRTKFEAARTAAAANGYSVSGKELQTNFKYVDNYEKIKENSEEVGVDMTPYNGYEDAYDLAEPAALQQIQTSGPGREYELRAPSLRMPLIPNQLNPSSGYRSDYDFQTLAVMPQTPQHNTDFDLQQSKTFRKQLPEMMHYNYQYPSQYPIHYPTQYQTVPNRSFEQYVDAFSQTSQTPNRFYES